MDHEREPKEKGWTWQLTRSFHHREFRWYWTGSTLAIASFRIQEVTLGWQMLELTDSALWVGAIAFVSGAPMLLVSPVAGLLADRFRRQRIVFAAMVLAAVASAILNLLITLELAHPIHLMVTSFLIGSSFALYAPARLALLPLLVPQTLLLNASTLEYSTTRLMTFVGPITAGLLLAEVGVSWALYVQMFAFAAAGLVFMNRTLGPDQMSLLSNNASGVFKGLREVSTYLRGNPPMGGLMILSLIIVPFGMMHTMLMHVFVRDALDSGPAILGIVLGLSGLGSAFSGLIIAARGDISRKGPVILWSSISFGIGIVLFSLTSQPISALILMLSIGMVSGIYLTLSNVLFQSKVPDRIRGRILSAWGMVWGLIPITSLAAGAAAEQVGIRPVFVLSGFACILICLIFGVNRSPLLKL